MGRQITASYYREFVEFLAHNRFLLVIKRHYFNPGIFGHLKVEQDRVVLYPHFGVHHLPTLTTILAAFMPKTILLPDVTVLQAWIMGISQFMSSGYRVCRVSNIPSA
jgi:hypothetical protein